MATLRELRQLAKEMEIPYEKRTSKTELENLIAEKMASLGIDSDEPTPEETKKEPLKFERKPVKELVPDTGEMAPTAEKATVAPDSFESAIRIDPENLNNEFMTQAENYYHFAKAEGVANAEVMKAKLLLETVEADLYKEIRNDFDSKGTKVTEKMLTTEITQHERYLGARKKMIQATATHSIARAARDAFIQRKDMLIQLGLSKRQEKDQDVTIMHEKAKRAIAAA